MECEHWDRVAHRVRVRSLLSSMADKLEGSVTADQFKPAVGDFLKVLDAEQSLEPSQGDKEMTVQWRDPGPTLLS